MVGRVLLSTTTEFISSSICMFCFRIASMIALHHADTPVIRNALSIEDLYRERGAVSYISLVYDTDVVYKQYRCRIPGIRNCDTGLYILRVYVAGTYLLHSWSISAPL